MGLSQAHPIPFAESNEYYGAPEIAPFIDTPHGRDRLDFVAMMPILAVPTLYSRIGDVFAWVAIVALVGIAIRAMLGRRTTMTAPVPEPLEAPFLVA